MSDGVTRTTNGWDGAVVDSGGCWGTSSPTRVETKVEQVFNLFALEMPMERRRVVGFEGVLDGDESSPLHV